MELADPLMKSSRMSLPKRIKGIEFISRRKSSYEYRLNVCIIMSPWMNKWSVWCFGLAPECSILVWRTFDGHVLCCCQFRFDHSATRFPNPARQQSTDGTDDRVSFYEFPVVSVLWISGCDCRYFTDDYVMGFYGSIKQICRWTMNLSFIHSPSLSCAQRTHS